MNKRSLGQALAILIILIVIAIIGVGWFLWEVGLWNFWTGLNLDICSSGYCPF